MIYCDKCKKNFEIKIETESMDDGIGRVYFICPHCKTEYTNYYLDNDIKAKQQRIRILQLNYNRACEQGDIQQARKLFKNMQCLAKEIGNEMNNLKIQIEG